MKKSIRTKISVLFLCVIIGCMAIMSLGCDLFLRPLFIHDSKKSMKRYGSEVCASVENEDDMESIRILLDKINNSYLIHTVVLSADYNVLVNENGSGTGTISNSMQRTIDWLREYEAEEGMEEPFFRERYDDNYQIRRLFYVQKTKNGKYVIMDKAVKGMEQDSQLVLVFITIMGLTVAVLGCVFWNFLTRPFTGQMEKMSQITRDISRLNFDEKINYHSQDEIGILAESIDELSDRLRESIEKLQSDIVRRKLLIRNISHELKTPITTIRGYAENTQIVTEGNERVQKYCEIMIEECDEIERLVSEMLEMSRLEDSEANERTVIESKKLFDSIRQKAEMEFPGIEIKYQTEDCTMMGNEKLLERAVQNYIRNAVKYGKADGKITVSGSWDQENFRITVTNEGTDIPQGELDVIWDVFYKGDKSRKRDKSHGVGLSIVHQTAKLLHGNVGVSSQDGLTAFWICVPLA